jgi:hypothetical protein
LSQGIGGIALAHRLPESLKGSTRLSDGAVVLAIFGGASFCRA